MVNNNLLDVYKKFCATDRVAAMNFLEFSTHFDLKRELALEYVGTHYYQISNLDGSQCMRMICHFYLDQK